MTEKTATSKTRKTSDCGKPGMKTYRKKTTENSRRAMENRASAVELRSMLGRGIDVNGRPSRSPNNRVKYNTFAQARRQRLLTFWGWRG